MIFVYYFVATSGSAVEPNCRICLAWPAGRWSDPFHWLDCFIFQQAKPSNHVYFWFFEEEVVRPHYLECWSFFDRFRHAERSKQWNQGELPISPFFCLAASLEGRQIQTNQSHPLSVRSVTGEGGRAIQKIMNWVCFSFRSIINVHINPVKYELNVRFFQRSCHGQLPHRAWSKLFPKLRGTICIDTAVLQTRFAGPCWVWLLRKGLPSRPTKF